MKRVFFITHYLQQAQYVQLLAIIFFWAIMVGSHQKTQAQQKRKFRVKNEGLLNLTNYLPTEYKGHAQNWSFAQDNRGMMYVGNVSGVLQFDGSYWKKLPVESFQILKGKDDRLYTSLGFLKPDSLGRIKYVSFLPLLPKKDHNLATPYTRELGWASGYVVFHKIGALFLYKKGKLEAIPLTLDFIRPMLIINDEVCMVKKGVGLMKMPTKGNVARKWMKIPGGEIFADKNITSATRLANGKWLLTTRQSGLFLMDKTTFSRWDVPVNTYLAKNQINCSLSLNADQIALGTLRDGVLIIDKDGNPVQHINYRNGLQSNYVKQMFLDKDRGLWLALNNGIARVETNRPFSLWNKTIGLKGSLNHIGQVHQGKFYVGTSQGVFYKPYVKNPNPLSPQSQFKHIEATQGSVFYLLTTPEGVLCAHRKGIFEINDSTARKLVTTNGVVFTIVPLQANGKQYALAGGTKEMILLEKKAGQWQFKNIVKGHEGYTRRFHQDAEGYIWIATANGVLKTRLSPGLDQFIDKKMYTMAQGLPAKNENRAFGLRNKQLVLATLKGVYIYNKAQDKFVPHPILTTKLQVNEQVQWIIEDQDQNIWLWLKNGVIFARKDAQKGYVLERNLFNKFKELFSNYMAPHVIPINHQNILFETRDGVVHYNRELMDDSYQQEYEVLIRSIYTTKGQDSLIFGGNFTPNSPLMINKQPKRFINLLPYQLNNIRFTFSAVYYENTEKTKYSYILQNFDKEWSEWTSETKKEYTNLPAGEYVFKVKAKNVYGVISKETSYKLVVAAPWYQTTGAYIVFGVLIILTIWGIVYLNTRRLKAQKAKLEHIVETRTQEIQIKNQELEAQKEEISSQAMHLAEQTNFLKTANEEIETQNQALEAQKKEIAKSYKNVQMLSKIGKEITATFSIKEITNIVYQHIQGVMDVEEFGIGYYLPKPGLIDFKSYFYQGEALPPLMVPMSNKNRLSVYCIDHQQEVIINDLLNEYGQYINSLEEYEDDVLLSSMVCLPLMVGDEVIGITSVQSSKKNAYSENQINILRNLAIYIAIALKNASSFAKIEEQNTQITHSIRYAQNIQKTILPTNDVLNKYLKDHFVIFWPKDIVSGDFYWIWQPSHLDSPIKYTFAAVVDCTGHGVPGAFMSLIGYQLLNEIVVLMKLKSPALILEHLDNLVISSLKQRKSKNNDGMDVCLCRIHTLDDGSTELVYAGAKRNLLYVEADGKVKKIKGDRISIGGYELGKQNRFTDHKLHLQPESILYLSTDGIVDMPNAQRRSFGDKRLQQLIEKNVLLSLKEQKKVFEQTLKEYQGNQEQRDDISLMVIKV